MATMIKRILGGALPDRDDKESVLTPLQHIVSYTIGEDPTAAHGIPQPLSTLQVGGIKYTCDRVRVSKVISDTRCIVECLYSTNNHWVIWKRNPDENSPFYYKWDLTYKKSRVMVPLFTRAFQETETQSVEWYQQRSVDLELEMPVLNITVAVTAVTNPQVQAVIRAAGRPIGQLHRIPGLTDLSNIPGFESHWKYEAPSVVGGDAERGRIFVSYTWTCDPGNNKITVPPQLVDRFVNYPFDRPGFYKYVVVEGDPSSVPIVDVVDLYPTGSTFWVPEGWRGLPGGPI